MIKKIFIVSLSGIFVFLVLRMLPSKKLISPLQNQITNIVTSVQNAASGPIFPDKMEAQILDKINELRLQNNKKALLMNSDLAKAATARLAVISLVGDYTGSQSGLTREKAYELVNYDTTHIGDLNLYLLTPDDNFLNDIKHDEVKLETLLLDSFTEVGISELINNRNNREYYLLFGNRRLPLKKVTPTTTVTRPTVSQVKTWGGPELWEAVNKRRVEFGVNKLSKKDELCTIASIRLNQLLELKKLDGHAGFKPVLEREDLKWISEKYNVSEYLAQGYPNPEETVKGWENTLGHKRLLTGGEYVWGCVYSQNTYAVAIAAY